MNKKNYIIGATFNRYYAFVFYCIARTISTEHHLKSLWRLFDTPYLNLKTPFLADAKEIHELSNVLFDYLKGTKGKKISAELFAGFWYEKFKERNEYLIYASVDKKEQVEQLALEIGEKIQSIKPTVVLDSSSMVNVPLAQGFLDPKANVIKVTLDYYWKYYLERPRKMVDFKKISIFEQEENGTLKTYRTLTIG